MVVNVKVVRKHRKNVINWFCINQLSTFSLVDAKPQCVTNSDCNIDQQCYQGSCRFACSAVSCGINAACVPQFHNGVCQCFRGFSGNPNIACTKGKSWELFIFTII